MRFRQQFQMQTHPRQWRSQFVRDVSGKQPFVIQRAGGQQLSLYLVCHVLIFLQPYPGPRAGSLLPVLQEKLPVMQLCNAADNT